MTEKEVDDLILDVNDALMEIGALQDTEGQEIFNMTWKKHVVPTSYNKVYRQDTNPTYVDYPIAALCVKRVKADELLKEGLNTLVNAAVSKVYVAGLQFSNIGKPDEADQIITKGVVYDIAKLYSIDISDKEVLWIIFIHNASITQQTEENREEVDPLFEYDDTKRTDLTSFPAVVNFQVLSSYVITDGNFYIKLTGATVTKEKLVIPAGEYTQADLKTEIDDILADNFGETLITDITSGVLSIQSVETGSSVFIDILPTENACYSALGIYPSRYTGSDEILGV